MTIEIGKEDKYVKAIVDKAQLRHLGKYMDYMHDYDAKTRQCRSENMGMTMFRTFWCKLLNYADNAVHRRINVKRNNSWNRRDFWKY